MSKHTVVSLVRSISAKWVIRLAISLLTGLVCIALHLGSNVAIGSMLLIGLVIGLTDPETMLVLGLVCMSGATLLVLLSSPGEWHPNQNVLVYPSYFGTVTLRPVTEWMASNAFEALAIGIGGIIYRQVRETS